MTRIPSFIEGAGGGGGGSVRVPSSQIALPAPARVLAQPSPLGPALNNLARSLEQMGRRRLQAQRARTLTEIDSNAIEAFGTAFDDALKVDPSEMERVFDEHASIVELKDQINGIEDGITRTEAAGIFKERMARVRRSLTIEAGKEEASRGRVAVIEFKQRLGLEVRAGKEPLIATDELDDRLKGHVGTAYTTAGAKKLLDAATLEFYREHVDFLLNGTATSPPAPGDVDAFLDREDVRKVMTPAQRTQLRNQAARDVEDENDEMIIARFSIAEQTLDNELALDGVNAEDFGKLVKETAAALKALPGFEGALDDVLLALLADPLEAAARMGDIHRFTVVAAALPAPNSDAQIMLAKASDMLLRAIGQTNKQDLINARVEDARKQSLALDKNTANKDAVNQFAQKEIEAMRAENPEIGLDDLSIELIRNWGPTTLLPSQITRVPSAIARNPSAFSPAEVQSSFDIMTFARNTHPRSYEQSFDTDVRKFHKLFIRMMAPGADSKEIAGFVHEALNPTDLARAAALSSVMDSLVTDAMSAFVEFAKEDPNFEIELEGDFEMNRLFNVEQEGLPIFRTDVFNDVVPPDMTQRYIDFFQSNMNRGMTKEAAQIDAWERIVDAGYGVTNVFQEESVIRKLAPERVYGGTGDEIALDLANRIGLDNLDGKIIWPDVMQEEGEQPFPSPIRLPEKRTRVGVAPSVAARPGPAEPTETIVLGETTTFRAMRQDRLNRILFYAESRLDVVPVGNETEGLAILGPDGGRLPLYQLLYIDSEGRPHPVMTTALNPITGEQEPETYKLAPIRSEGISHARTVQRKNLTVQKALREVKRRNEAVEGHRKALERTRELERKKQPTP